MLVERAYKLPHLEGINVCIAKRTRAIWQWLSTFGHATYHMFFVNFSMYKR